MAKEIIWTKRADRKFLGILEYLKTEWSLAVAEAFLQRTYEFLDVLAKFPELGTLQYPAKNIRGFVLTKHITVFYKIEGQKILLLTFFDNRQNRRAL